MIFEKKKDMTIEATLTLMAIGYFTIFSFVTVKIRQILKRQG
ncbi:MULTISPECIES: hypothetical protein [Roseivirga]|jgi:hypothetical protein|nr:MULTISPECIES: hypothetical protein [Roseivirga]WPZ08894.1 hypothetical protein T7867_11575 [Roseivirga spongicola]